MTISAVILASALTASGWVTVEPGLEHATIARNGAVVEVLRFDRLKFRFQVVVPESPTRLATARALGRATGAIVAVNGGFFDPEFRPVGLRRSGGHTIAGRLSLGLAALVINRDGARVVMGSDAMVPIGEEVVQCGPRLVVGGVVNRLKEQVARRTVVAIDAAGRLSLIVTRRGVLGASELARWLSAPADDGGLAAIEALNLDGGPSSQLWAEVAGLSIDIRGNAVADALVVSRR